MKKVLIATVSVLFLLVAANMVITADKAKNYYVCNCKDNCACNYVSAKAGKCNCGSALVEMHLLAIENTNGVFCRCGKDCTCERSKDDPGKCGCGKAVKMVGLKGKYICSCGPECNCGTISDMPGKCHCGKALKKVA